MENVIIYGAGARGKGIYNYFKKHGKEDVVAGFCDRDYKCMAVFDGKKIMSFEEACGYRLPFLVSITDADVDCVRQMIERQNGKWLCFDDMAGLFGKDRVSLNRDFCAFFHINGMDGYFESAEEMLEGFWGDGSPFLKRFQRLDLENVIELACGRGRHVPRYRHKAGKVTLVDILEENIEACKKRFGNEKNIFYYCNNGYNMEKLVSDSYTALFSYDAMVHFEMMDIYEYLRDICRVLVPGGMALIHHSNYTGDYKASFASAPNGRSFMGRDIFAYLAYRAGFEIVEQEVIDWGVKELDCISLIQKPKN